MKRICQNHYSKISALLAIVVLLVPTIASAQLAGLIGLDAANVESVLKNAAFNVVVAVTGMLVTFGGSLLNFGINNFVIGFGDQFLNSGVGVAVDSVWVIIRDFMNLFFIFGLVYIGFKMILGSDNSNTRRWLINLIIAALLINFSLFFTKIVVDFSNQIASQIAVSAFEGTQVTRQGQTKYEVDMAGNLMNRMGITTAFSNSNVNNGGWGYIAGTGIFFLITAFVFFAGGILLIIRFAALNLFLVLSPVMFIGWILPPVSDVMNRYWKEFLGRAFFAPIFLLFIYFSLKILDGLNQSISGSMNSPNIAAATSGQPGAEEAILGTLPYFVLICIFMIFSLYAADKLGADGAGKALSIGKSWGNKASRGVAKGAGSASFGLAARVGRNTVGQAASSFADSERGKRWAASNLVGKTLFKTAGKVADSNFDVRSVGGLGSNLGIGEGKKGGYETAYKEKLQKEEKFLESIKMTEDDAKEGSAKPDVDAFKAAEKKLDDEKEKEEKKVALDRQPHDIEINRLKALYAAETDADKKEKIAKEMEQQRGFIKDIKDQSDARIKVFEKTMKEAEKKMNESITKAQYEQVDTYLNNQEKWSQGVRSGLRKGAIIAAGVTGIPGAAAALGMQGEYHKDEAIKKELRKKIEGEKKKRRKGEKPTASTPPPTTP